MVPVIPWSIQESIVDQENCRKFHSERYQNSKLVASITEVSTLRLFGSEPNPDMGWEKFQFILVVFDATLEVRKCKYVSQCALDIHSSVGVSQIPLLQLQLGNFRKIKSLAIRHVKLLRD